MHLPKLLLEYVKRRVLDIIITNGILSLGKLPFKKEIKQPNNYKKVFECI